jgi:cytochrome c-type biogenesis protein CcmH/NrfG
MAVDPFDRIVWLLIILALSIVGTILYFLFGMESASSEPVETDLDASDAELKRRANEGELY